MKSEKELLKEIEALITQRFRDNPEELKRLKEESKKMASEKEHRLLLKMLLRCYLKK